MKKLCLPIILAAACAFILCGCDKKVDYYSFVSEYRHDVYLYEEDGMCFKLYCTDKETPYSADGVKGMITPVTEIFFSADDTPEEVEVSVCGHGGEMNYLSVTRNFYLSFTANDVSGAKISVDMTVDGKKLSFDATNVKEEGTIDGATALKCVTEYDGERFASLTNGKNFAAEISIRLLYDEGCYYYVGVCDREGKIHAYLSDAKDGRVIAERDAGA